MFCSSTATTFYFSNTSTPAIYTLSLHDALPICRRVLRLADDLHDLVDVVDGDLQAFEDVLAVLRALQLELGAANRSEEHTSELQSRGHLVCRLLLEKKKSTLTTHTA